MAVFKDNCIRLMLSPLLMTKQTDRCLHFQSSQGPYLCLGNAKEQYC